MVYPVNAIIFKIGLNGKDSTAEDMAVVKDMEQFEVSFDNGVEQWSALDQDGWARRLMTAKAMSVSVKGKRNYGDLGNDYIAGLAYKNGTEATSILSVVFPDVGQLNMPCVINVTESDGGSSGDVAALSFECLSDGKPSYVRG